MSSKLAGSVTSQIVGAESSACNGMFVTNAPFFLTHIPLFTLVGNNKKDSPVTSELPSI